MSLCPGGRRKETRKMLTSQSSIPEVQTKDCLCQAEFIHAYAHTHAPSAESFHIQLSVSDSNKSSQQQYCDISFHRFPLLVSCALLVHGTAHKSQAVCTVLSSWPQKKSLRHFILRRFEELGFHLLLLVLFLSPAAPSFQQV